MVGVAETIRGVPGLLILPIVALSSFLTLLVTLLIVPLFDPPALSSLNAFKEAWFKYFWWWFGPVTKPVFAPSIRPLLDRAYGVVLDIGPASGIWIEELGRVFKTGTISRVYGVEPNPRFHSQLEAKIKAAGLLSVYQPIVAYAEELEA
ncbi:hypothetical protein LTR22_028496, partial [Elasticomyces elasticus]